MISNFTNQYNLTCVFFFLDVTIVDLLDKGKIPSLEDPIKKWYYQLGQWLNQNNHVKITDDELDSLEKFSHIRGSPTISMFKALQSKSPNACVNELSEWAKENKREDVLEIINRHRVDNTQKLNSLSYIVQLELANKLDEELEPALKNWYDLAIHFNFGFSERLTMKNSQQTRNRLSKTEGLLERLIQLNPSLRLDVFIEWAKSTDLNEVAKDLCSFKEQLLQERGSSL